MRHDRFFLVAGLGLGLGLVALYGCDDAFPNLECSPARGVECDSVDETCVDNVCVAICYDDDDCAANEKCGPSDYCIERVVALCSSEDPCDTGFFCDTDATCTKKFALGHLCEAETPEQCLSGICADGVCCDSACKTGCEACVAVHTGGTDGYCADVSAGLDPADDCSGALACDGAGACFAKDTGDPCAEAYECVSDICDGGNCADTVCGDASPGGTEECDLGTDNNDGSYGGCNPSCTLASFCGDNDIDDGYGEICDDGLNDGSYGGCNPGCMTLPAFCGDGDLDASDSEDCDDGDTVDSGNGCSTSCTDNHFCGNGNIEELFEECEPPNSAVCSSTCQSLNPCGNGTIESVAGETCDDDNAASGDGCSSTCQLEAAWLCSGEPSDCTRIIYVNDDATGANTGLSWTNAYTDLQTALAEAPVATRPTEIWVAAGTYVPGAARNDTFALKNGVGVYGGFGGYEATRSARNAASNSTVLSGDLNGDDSGAANKTDNSYHVVSAISVNDTAVLDGVTISLGHADGTADPQKKGGGLSAANASAAFTNLIITDNYAEIGGGGLYNLGGGLALSECDIHGNEAGDGGGFYNDTGILEIRSSNVDGNTAISGAGIFNANGTVTVTDSNMTSNSGDLGGGICSSGGHLRIKRTEFADMAPLPSSSGAGIAVIDGADLKAFNVKILRMAAEYGVSAVYATSSTVMLVNTEISEVESTFSGTSYGVYAADSEVTVLHSTIAGESSCLSVCKNLVGVETNGGSLEIGNSVLSNTVHLDGPPYAWYQDVSAVGGATVTINNSFVYGYDGTGSGNITNSVDPGFVGLYDDLRLSAGSACIDNGLSPLPADQLDIDDDGDSTEPLPLDLKGDARDQGNDPDMGAYEY